ncbi:MAG: addiction module protein [Alphaproteobacteria bacterium CG_4_10_14_0_2_um_filter_63_37]|nr:MAG: addiction module protein [Proteobacteria bacterium CG1_02_64_396]PJA24284.1 MAG: addiction module protein [Alphaproteobacteria bacterium CG_4_10_14_0_2_um_filter_63_37]
MSYARHLPYNDLPLIPPVAELETRAVLKQAIAANRNLADLRGLARQIPNPRLLINSIVLQEARLSSQIENIVTTNDELFRAAADPERHADPHTKEVLRYRQALWFGFDALQQRPLSTNLFVEIVRIIKSSNYDVRRATGTTLINQNDGSVLYTPPEGETVIRDKLTNLERFIHAHEGVGEGLDPLVKLAVLHYQFEAIHPFPDGNGRTGRILNILYLVEQGLLDLPILFLSHYILHNRPVYYERLRQVTEEGGWEAWILFMLEAVAQTSKQTAERISRIVVLMEEVRLRVQTESPRIYSKDLIEAIFMHPYCKIRFLEESGIAKRQTASGYLRTLADLGVLRPLKIGKEWYYINDALLGALVDA